MRRRRSARLSARLILPLITTLPGALHAQSEVRSITLSADLDTDDGSAIVSVRIELTAIDSAGLRIELLNFAGTNVEGFHAGGPDGPLIRFEQQSGSREWVVFDARDVERNGFGNGRIVATWVVHNARITTGEAVRVDIPVLTAALPPVRDAGDIFHADIRVPSIWFVTESFPTGLRPGPDGSYTVDLPVAPSVITIRARTDGAWRPGAPLLLDALAGAILLAFVIVGWRHLRAAAASPDPTAPAGVAPAAPEPR